jgi:hypothetical protein
MVPLSAWAVEESRAKFMTAGEFRKVALSLPGAEERAHMNHPDFRVGGKIFATLGYPDAGWGMVRLSPEEQHNYLTSAPEVFSLASGAWGRQGATMVRLKAAKKTLLKKAIESAWEVAAAKAKTKRA